MSKHVWMWRVLTTKGQFFMTVIGLYNQAEAAKKVWRLFELLGLDITVLQDRQRVIGPESNTGTLIEQAVPENELGCEFMAGPGFYQACGRQAEYEARVILLKAGSPGEKHPEVKKNEA